MDFKFLIARSFDCSDWNSGLQIRGESLLDLEVEGTIMHEITCLAGFVDPGTPAPVDKFLKALLVMERTCD